MKETKKKLAPMHPPIARVPAKVEVFDDGHLEVTTTYHMIQTHLTKKNRDLVSKHPLLIMKGSSLPHSSEVTSTVQ